MNNVELKYLNGHVEVMSVERYKNRVWRRDPTLARARARLVP